MKLQKIEADVVIVIRNTENGTGKIYPMWECEMELIDMHEMAARMALAFVEESGEGMATYAIHDFRGAK